MAPIEIDGTDITGATIDGTDVQEITVDGQTVFTAGPPDSAVLNYDASNFASPWPNDIAGQPDMSITGLTSSTLINGDDGVSGDGTNDNGQVDLPSNFEGSSLQTHTIEFSVQFSHTDETDICGNFDTASNQFLTLRANRNENDSSDAGNFRYHLEDDSGDDLRIAPDSNPGINDGNLHKITIEIVDSSTNDANIYIDGSAVTVATGQTNGPSNFSSWGGDMRFFARDNRSGNARGFWQGDMGIIRWHDEATGGQTI